MRFIIAVIIATIAINLTISSVTYAMIEREHKAFIKDMIEKMESNWELWCYILADDTELPSDIRNAMEHHEKR